MKYKTFDHLNCSLAQTLSIIGERWTLLILRDAFFGAKQFNQFERNLGIAKNILSARLNMLVNEGILERRAPREGGRHDYILTEQGLDLQPVLLSMTHWGDKHRPNPKGDRIIFIDREQGRPIQRMGPRHEDGHLLAPRDIKAIPGPGLDNAPWAAPFAFDTTSS